MGKPSLLIGTTVLFIVALALVAPTVHCSDGPLDHPIRFAVIGDRTGEHQEGVYEETIAEVARMQPDFVVTVGDHIEGYSQDTAVINGEWREYLKIVEPLAGKIHFTPGNHDITFDEMQPSFERFVGKPYRSFDEHGLHFIVLDNSRWWNIEEFPTEELEWLTEDLKQHVDAPYTFVFFHVPYWYRTIAQGKPDTLHSLFRAYGVDAVFTGHFHSYFTGEFDNILYTGIGSSGADCEESPTGLKYHFAWITVDNDGIHIAPVKVGSVLPWDEMTVSEALAVSKVVNNAFTFPAPVPVQDNLTVDNAQFDMLIDVPNSGNFAEDTLSWDVPDSWTVEPATVVYRADGENPGSATFTATCSGSLYPLPTVSSRVTYAADRRVSVNRTLPIGRQATCNKVSTAPKIDGDLSDKSWQNPVRLLLGPSGGDSPIDSTELYFAYDEHNLYYAARCTENVMDSMMATLTERDAAVFGEDCVGIMVQPMKGDSTAYQIYVNPLGTVYDQRLYETSDGYWESNNLWNGEYDIKSTRGDGVWTIEAKVPLDQFGISAKEGDRWPLNFRRKQRRFNSFAGFQIPWSYDPATYGVLVFK